jgi:hypothetical protein
VDTRVRVGVRERVAVVGVARVVELEARRGSAVRHDPDELVHVGDVGIRDDVGVDLEARGEP